MITSTWPPAWCWYWNAEMKENFNDLSYQLCIKITLRNVIGKVWKAEIWIPALPYTNRVTLTQLLTSLRFHYSINKVSWVRFPRSRAWDREFCVSSLLRRKGEEQAGQGRGGTKAVVQLESSFSSIPKAAWCQNYITLELVPPWGKGTNSISYIGVNINTLQVYYGI